MAPLLVLLFVALWFILRGDLFYVLPCVILFLCCCFFCCCFFFFFFFFCFFFFFSPFSIAITSLGEERANLSAFRTFVRFALVWFCLFPLPLGIWEGMRFVIVAFPGLFSYNVLLPFVLSFHNHSALLVMTTTRKLAFFLNLYRTNVSRTGLLSVRNIFK